MLAVEKFARLIAATIALTLAAIAVRHGVYSANHADASGYIAEGELWSSGTLVRPAPMQLWAAWPDAATGSPLGFRPGPVRGTDVPFYPPGFPLLLAAATRVGGETAMYLVAPFFGAALVLATFAVGQRMGGGISGLVAAILVATSPVTLLHVVHPMSDVPAAACWAGAWYFAMSGSRGGPVTAGVLTALAIAIRPNLVPLAAIPFGLFLVEAIRGASGSWRWGRVAQYAAAASVGPALVAWTQWELYGHPFQPGYPGWEAFFRVEHIRPNLANYPQLWREVYGWVPLLGAAFALVGAVGPWAATMRRDVVGSAFAFATLNVATYLPYLEFAHWPFLRFLLPATVAIFVLFGAVSAAAIRWARPRGTAAVAVAVATVLAATLAVTARRTDLQAYALNDWKAQARIPMMGRYLREVLPPNAVVLSFIHSGAVSHYTGRPIVRLDLLEPATLDRVVADLQRYGLEPSFVLDDALETPLFAGRFSGSRYAALDWPARAEFLSVTSIRYLLAADLERFQRGERWPTDRLK
jgi:hypothetical protein